MLRAYGKKYAAVRAKALAAYNDFFALWRNADPSVPIPDTRAKF